MPKRPSGPVGGFVTESIKRIHDWALWSLVQGKFTGPDGASFTRSFVTSPGAVGVVALRELPVAQPHVVLVRQYRPALHRLTLELPAGMRDQPDEPALETAQRELREEVGLTAREWTRLGCHISAPGISDSQVELFLARSLEQVDTDRHGPEEQHMTTEEVALSDALTMVADGVIDDAKTVIGLLLTEQLLRRG